MNGFKAWVCTYAQGFVQTLPAQLRIFSDLCHASRPRYVTKSSNKDIRVWIFSSRRQIFGNDFVIVEISRSIEFFVCCFHCLVSFSSRAIFFAREMSFACDDLSPPTSKT